MICWVREANFQVRVQPKNEIEAKLKNAFLHYMYVLRTKKLRFIKYKVSNFGLKMCPSRQNQKLDYIKCPQNLPTVNGWRDIGKK